MNYLDFILNSEESKSIKDSEVHIVASGPSLLGFDYSIFDDKKTIAVNHSYKMIANPLWTVSRDSGFILDEDRTAPYRTKLISKKLANYDNIIEVEKSTRFSMNPEDGLFTIKNSGLSAIVTALHAGASKIYIYGFDCFFADLDLANEILKYNGSSKKLDKLPMVWEKKVNKLNRKITKKIGHATDDKFIHRSSYVDQHKDWEETFRKKIPYFEELSKLPRGLIVNMSPWSKIPYFEKPVSL